MLTHESRRLSLWRIFDISLKAMTPIDQQFRPKKDFFIAWFVIAVVAVAYARPWAYELPWFSKIAWVLVVPFILTFFIYGPILFLRQVVRSGSRGWFVFRVFASICLSTALFLGTLYLIEREASLSGSPWGVFLSFLVIVLFNLIVGKREANQPAQTTPRGSAPRRVCLQTIGGRYGTHQRARR